MSVPVPAYERDDPYANVPHAWQCGECGEIHEGAQRQSQKRVCLNRLPSSEVRTTSNLPGRAFPESWRLLDDVQILELPDPEFLIDSILQRKGVAVIYAPSGAGKTTLIASLLTAVATGRDFFGHKVNYQGASVYVATEDPAGFKVRLRSAKSAADLPLDQSVGVYTFPNRSTCVTR